LFPHSAISHCATADSRTVRVRRVPPRAASTRAKPRPVRLAERRASPDGLPASDRSAPPAVLQDSLCQGSEKETARVPPSLDSPRSAAPETFLLRDAVSAFPIAFGPLPQSLPSARYPVRAVPVRSPWRSFWNHAHPLRGRAGRLFPFPTIDSQFRLPSTHRQCSSSYQGRPLRGTKIPALLDQAACSKLPSRPRPRPPSESPTLVRPPQSSRTATARSSPSPQTSSVAPA